MPVYYIKSPSGSERIGEAKTRRQALDYVIDDEYTIGTLTAVGLAVHVKQALMIESLLDKSVDEHQGDIEAHIGGSEAA